ncbi:DUF11 domain-containing protein [Chroococcidiopsis sp. TS-821]|uniref:DUF11 domain-containing protein n=1 Tax=Chroococcidiopsis sp. TS-821 TaxID=1378066 RepID=UPI000CEF2CE4|nr:DUF11 domain-containing protein [Chroococcidiopsis sp. TS-821]PPS43282.1 hypothetical protein B1A85_11300 [Chroococcidiopsis sp. TS-821]
MKSLTFVKFAAIALTTALPFVALPAMQQTVAIAQTVQRQQAQMQLNLAAAKKVVTKDAAGKPQVTWQTLKGNVVVQPGDTLRYTVTSENTSDRAVRNFVVTQPIPKQTTYVLKSATAPSGTKMTYSIDNGKTFVENPTIQVKLPDGKVETRPAPAERYTHIRWQYTTPINAKSTVNASYQVRVR